MFLKQLEINGFKSFSEKIELSFSKGINAIVGPNGSGKSNIADAIRWVIGEQSVRTLRGNKMEDIIFAGSDKMKAAGFAEATLVLDNTDKGINLDFNEISITRRMYRSGESEYYINKTQCRLKDIVEMFMDTGIGKDGYSIIGQGKIDEVLSNKSDDRRAIFEEAAGISKYKYRKLESEKKLERTEQNIIRIQDIIHEVKGQLEPLAEQAEITRKYQKLLHELKTLEVNLIITGIDKSINRLKSITSEIESLQNSYEQKKNDLEQLEQKQEAHRIAIKDLETELNLLNQKIYGLINSRDKIESEEKIYYEKTNFVESTIDKLSKEKKMILEEKGKIALDIEENNNKLKLLECDIISLSNTITIMDTEYKQKYSAIIDMENEIENMKQLQINQINKLSDIKSKLNGLNSIISSINNRIKQLNIDNELLKGQYDEKLAMQNKIEKDFLLLIDRIKNEKNIVDSIKADKFLKEQQIKKTEELLVKTRSKKDNILSRLKLLEEMERGYEGYNKTIKSILTQQYNIKSKVTGFKGVVGELITVPEEYAVAIEIALGPAVQNIVTNCEEDAKRLIELLKKNNMGRATFLPISSIKPRKINSIELKNIMIPGFIGIAAEMIQYSNEYKNIIHYLLGRIAVVDNINTAIKLARISNYEIKIVTIDGELVNVGGAITGGSKSYSTGTILTRKIQITSLKNEYRFVLMELEELGSKLNLEKQQLFDLDKQIANSIEKLHNLEIDLANVNNKSNSIKNDLELIQSKIAINNKDIEELSKEKIEISVTIELNNNELIEVEKEKDELQKDIQLLQENIKHQKDERDGFIKELTALKVKEAEWKQQKNSLEQIINSQKDTNISINAKIQNIIEEIDNKKVESEKIKIAENLIKSQIEDINKQIIQNQDDLNLKEEEKIKQIDSLEKMNIEIKQCQMELSNLQSSLYKIDLQKAKNEMEIENLELKLLDTYEMNYKKASALRLEDFNISKSSKRCEELKDEIKSLGTINVNAVEEYERLNNRYSFLNTQLDDLEKAKDSLINVINEITNHMKKQFLDEFNKINKNFNEVFVKLFGGGMAEVVLADKGNVLESGIEIIVKPPNKKLQNLMLMSGGERALTAIALLFGILIMKPVPFCVLDEIDSALDDVNVGRYAKYLKELAADSQFIIITHRKGSMEVADCLYGVSMEDTGTSKLLSVKFEDKVS